MNADDLRAFAQDIAETFNRGEIKAPIHLDGGNEDQLIDIFKTIDRQDWVCGSWRMMSKCLLHGVPAAELKAAILAGRSISLCFPHFRIVSSAIVGGILPIALGIAWQIKRRGGKQRVHCFLGDMTAATGIAEECTKYAHNFDLPIRWIVEDNNKSVCTTTDEAWAPVDHDGERGFRISERNPQVEFYDYTLPWPHAGAGKRVQF